MADSFRDHLTEDQIKDLASSHCYRVINNMNHDDLMSYAIQMMIGSFDKNPGMNDPDIDMLLGDIYIAEDSDTDSVSEFLIGQGIDSHVVDKIMKEYQFE